MNGPTSPPPIYAVIDHRASGAPRIVGEYIDPLAARSAADLLRWSGAAAEVVLLTQVPESDPA